MFGVCRITAAKVNDQSRYGSSFYAFVSGVPDCVVFVIVSVLSVRVSDRTEPRRIVCLVCFKDY